MLDILRGRGRLTRSRYFLWMLILPAATTALASLISDRAPWIASLAAYSWHPFDGAATLRVNLLVLILALPFDAARLRDANFSGWLALIPLALAMGIYFAGAVTTLFGALAFAFAIALLFCPPTRGPNRFGLDPRGWESPEHFERQRRELAGEQPDT